MPLQYVDRLVGSREASRIEVVVRNKAKSYATPTFSFALVYVVYAESSLTMSLVVVVVVVVLVPCHIWSKSQEADDGENNLSSP